MDDDFDFDFLASVTFVQEVTEEEDAAIHGEFQKPAFAVQH